MSVLRTAATAVAVSLAAAVAPATAVDIVTERFSLEVAPDAVATQDFACPDEQLISGGYSIDSVSGNRFDAITVTANTRFGTGNWRVGLFNGADETLAVGLAITIMCD